MAFQNRIVLFLVINYIVTSHFLGCCKVSVKKFENCDNDESYKVKINSTFKTVDDKQFMNATFIFTAPVDNNIRVNTSMETLVGNQYVYLFSINERKACEAMNKYFGEFWYDMERHAQMTPELCPIAKGRYHLHNFVPDWKKMTTLQSFPFGNLRFVFMEYDSKNLVFSCLVLEVINQL